MKPCKLHDSEALIRSVVWAFWWRRTGLRYFAALAVVLGLFIYSIATGDRSWYVGVLASTLCLATTLAIALYVIHYRGAIAKFRRMRSPEATFEVGDSRFRVTSDVGSSELARSTIPEVWRFPEYWLLFFSPAQFVTLPLGDLDVETCNLILDHAKSHRAKVAQAFD